MGGVVLPPDPVGEAGMATNTQQRRQGSADTPKRSGLRVVLAGAVLLIGAVVAFLLFGADQSDPGGSSGDAQGTALAHVHGLAVNPADGLLYVATHTGLWRLPDDGEAERVGDYSHDLMGFGVVDADHFVASGHPGADAHDLPPLLGLIESTDGGASWDSVSLLGEADFHGLRSAHGKIYGYDSTSSSLLVSDDRVDWERRTQAPIIDFVVSPSQPDVIVAAFAEESGEVALMRSDDGGRSFDQVDGPALVRLSWQDDDRLWGVDVEGTLWRGTDGGGRWQEQANVGSVPEAFADTGQALYLSVEATIFESRDDGDSWQVRHQGG